MLGIVQGVTELLPISSSGHLILVPWLFDWDYLKTNDEFNQTFDVALHVGTLVAVVAYFWARRQAPDRGVGRERAPAADRDARTSGSPGSSRSRPCRRRSIGALGESFIAEHLGEPWQIAIFLAVFGVLLWIADRTPPRREMSDLGLGTALAVGFAQSARAHAGRLALGHHDHRGSLSRARPRLRRPLLVPPARSRSCSAPRLWKGITDVLLGDLPPGSTGPFVVGMIASAAAAASSRSGRSSATCAATPTRSSSSTGSRSRRSSSS